MVINLYIYKRDSGVFLYQDMGLASDVLFDIAKSNDYTLTPPPDSLSLWYWVNDKWQLEPKKVQSDKDL